MQNTTQVHVEWSGEGFEFTGFSPNGMQLAIDGNAGKGTSPMVLLLHAEAACSGIDVVDILRKMRSEPASLRVEVEAVRAAGDYPRIWETIHLRFHIGGDVDPTKAARAVEMSIEKYCSVNAMLSKAAVVTHEVVLG